MSEILFLGILALVVIGPKELPQLARTLGRFINELKRSTSVLTDEIKQHTRFDLDTIGSQPRRRPSHPPSEQDQDIHEADNIEHIHGGAFEAHETQASTEPEQMELTDQVQSDDKDKNEGHKPS